MSQIDVTRDVVDFIFSKKASDEKVQYSISIKEWTESNFKVKLDFTDPLNVSRGPARDGYKM